MKNIIIYGGRGNGTVILSTIRDINSIKKEFRVIGFVNNQCRKEKEIDGIPVLGDIGDLPALLEEYDSYFINAISSLHTIEVVQNHFKKEYKSIIKRLTNVIHPTAHFGYNIQIGKGVFIGPQCYIGQNVIIHDFSFIHAQCYIARDSILDKYSYLAPKVYIGAEGEISEGVYIGIGALLKERVKIGSKALIGMGSVIVHDIPSFSKYFGEKAKKRD